MVVANRDVKIKYGLIDGFSAGAKNILRNLTDTGKAIFFIDEGARKALGALKAVSGVNFVGAGLAAAGDFEDAIAKVGAVTGATTDQLEQLGAAATDAAADTRFSAQQAAEGLSALANEGQSADEAMQSLGPTLDLAQAKAIAVADAAGILDDTLDQFGLSAEDAAKATDAFVKASALGGQSAQQLAAGLTQVGPLARQTALSLEEASAALAALARNGIEGKKAGAALKDILAQLADPASRFSRELAQIGITSRDFDTVLAQLSTKGKAGEAALQALSTNGTVALRALLSDGGAALRDLTKQIENSGGAADAASDRLNAGYNAALQRIKNAFADLRREFVTPLLEPLAREIEGVTTKLRAFADTPEFAKIQKAFTDTFLKGVEFVKQFVSEFDFSAAINKAAQLAEKVPAFFRDVGEAARLTAEVVKGAATAIGTGISAIDTAVSGARLVGAKIAENVTGALGLVSDSAAQLSSDIAETRVELEDRFGRALDRTAEGLGRVTVEMEGADQATVAVGAAAAEAAQELPKLSAEAQAMADAINRAGVESEATAQKLAQLAAGDHDTAAANIASAYTRVAEALAQKIAPGAEDLAAIKAYEEQVAGSTDQAMKAWLGVSEAVNRSKTATEGAASAATQVAEQFEAAANEAGAIGEQASQGAAQAGAAVQGIADLLTALNAKFGAVSENARLLFVDMQRNAVRAEVSIGGVIRAILAAADATQEAIDAQQRQAASLAGLFDEFSAAGAAAAANLRGNFQRFTEGELREMALAIREGRTGLNLLNQQDLDQLAASAERAAQKVGEISAEAQAARDELRRLNNELLNTIDQQAGDEEAILQRQYEERLQQIQRLQDRGGQANFELAQQARVNAQRVLQAELEALEQRRRRERDVNQESFDQRRRQTEQLSRQPGGGVGGGASSSTGGRAGGSGGSGAGSAARPDGSGGLSVNVNVSGIAKDPEEIARLIGRAVEREVTRISRLKR